MKKTECYKNIDTVESYTLINKKIKNKYVKEKIGKDNKAITLIALVITIIVLLILAGVTIITLGGENGLIAKTKQAQKVQEIAEAQEELNMLIMEVQIEKNGQATLTDITEALKADERYTYIVKFSPTASLSSKGDVTGTSDIPTVLADKSEIYVTHKGYEFKIDQELTVTYVGENDVNINDTIETSYSIEGREDNKVKILIKVTDQEHGIKQIQCPDGDVLHYEGTKQKEEIGIDYKVELGVEYKFIITSVNGQTKEEIIKIDDYWYDVAKTLDEGASIDNQTTRAAYNKPYEATVTANDGYIIDTITVKMGGQTITTSGDNIVDNTTGQIKIANVTDNIEIIVTARKLEIVTTTPIINTSTSATSSLGANTQTKGTTLYINFNATLEGTNCTIEPSVPYAVTSNGKYKFTATGTYQNKTITKEIEVVVNQYQAAPDLVQYDAGDWTEGEINSLKNSKLYDLNASHSAGDGTFKLNSDSGLNFTFGGFTYKGDTANENTAGVITSRNKSVSPQSGYGTPKYDGWQIFTKGTKTDSSGNTIKNADGTERIYVTKIVHAGTPENFVYYPTADSDGCGAEYLLTGKANYGDTYKTLSNGTAINPRSWDMYKDKELDAKGYIKEVHAMTYSEANAASETIKTTGSYYSLGSVCTAMSNRSLWFVYDYGQHNASTDRRCWGVRPVVSLESGVYIASGDGTEASPYILAKE